MSSDIFCHSRRGSCETQHFLGTWSMRVLYKGPQAGLRDSGRGCLGEVKQRRTCLSEKPAMRPSTLCLATALRSSARLPFPSQKPDLFREWPLGAKL